MNTADTAMSSSTGQAKRNKGFRKDIKPRPLENQTTISLSLYIRDSVLTIAMKSDSVRMMGSRPRAE